MERTIYAVINDEMGTEVGKLMLTKPLEELEPEEIEDIVHMLAEKSPSWVEVLAGERIALLFDADSMITMAINTGE